MARSERVIVHLSERVFSDIELVAKAQGTPIASFVGDLIAREWRSPSFGALLRRIQGQQHTQSGGEHDD